MTEKQHNLKAKAMGMVPFETGDLFLDLKDDTLINTWWHKSKRLRSG